MYSVQAAPCRGEALTWRLSSNRRWHVPWRLGVLAWHNPECYSNIAVLGDHPDRAAGGDRNFTDTTDTTCNCPCPVDGAGLLVVPNGTTELLLHNPTSGYMDYEHSCSPRGCPTAVAVQLPASFLAINHQEMVGLLRAEKPRPGPFRRREPADRHRR